MCQVEFVADKFPGLKTTPELHMRCLYQISPDLQPLIGPHPDDPGVVVMCGFSGNGFQFAPAIAQYVDGCLQGGHYDGAGITDSKDMWLFKEMEKRFAVERFFR